MKKFFTIFLLLCIAGASFATSTTEKLDAMSLDKLQKLEKTMTALKAKPGLDSKKKQTIGKLLPMILIAIEKKILTPPVKDGDVVSVHYTLTLDSGEKLDTSRGENRQPLEFTLGNAQMIAGFEKAVLGMRVRDKKHVRISPQDAYGALYLETTIPLAEYREVITKSVFKGELIGIAAQDLSKHQADGVLGGSTIGTVKKIGDATIKVTAVTQDTVTVSIVDPTAPFYGKDIKVGMKTVDKNGNGITIKSINGDEVEIDTKPDQQILSKRATDITFKYRNTHTLAGKYLIFDIELISIKSPKIFSQSKLGQISPEEVEILKKNSYISGNTTAQILWIEYSDLECPYCKRLHDSGVIKNLQKKYGDKLAVSFKHYPLPFHSAALPAAHTVECIAEQKGSIGYFEAIERIFALGIPTSDVLSTVVADMKLDKKIINDCVSSGRFTTKIEGQMLEGSSKFDVNGTPGNVLINTKTGKHEIVSGAQPEINFQEAIERLLNS